MDEDVDIDKDLVEKVTSLKIVLSQTAPKRRRKPKSIKIPRREPSVVIPPRKKIYITPDKLQCRTCTCYPKDEPFKRNKPLRQCQHDPLTLYEYASKVLDGVPLPAAFSWGVEDVIVWMAYEVKLPQYEACMLDNHIDGRRLLLLEDPSKLPMINIKYFDHIKIITAAIRKLFGLDFIRFSRSIGLPFRRPLVNGIAFKSRTGPSWGIRKNWTYSDVIRWMKVLGPKPVKMDHWDLVWYLKPDFPHTRFARLPPRDRSGVEKIPVCTDKEPVDENYIPRKWRLNETPSVQMIWIDTYPTTKQVIDHFLPENIPIEYPIRESLKYQKVVDLHGLTGKDLVLAKRKQPKLKFFPEVFRKKEEVVVEPINSKEVLFNEMGPVDMEKYRERCVTLTSDQFYGQ